MPLKSLCPHCGATLRIGEQHVAQQVRCPSCQQKFAVQNSKGGSGGLPADTLAAAETLAPGLPQGSRAAVAHSPRATEKRTIGRFELRQVLGSGAFGRVYCAYDPQLDREVALKVPTFGPEDTLRVRRFLTEAKAAARLRHPNIVPVYESGKSGGEYFIASQFVAGQPLSQRIKAGPVDFRDAAQWVRSLADALAYAHAEGIVHRDIKPENVMLDAKGQPQLMDFGLAKRTSEDSGATVDGAILGTPAYMSPEQALGDQSKVGPASDQYSLGAVLYELLTGQRPFSGPPHAVIAQVIGAEPAPPRSLRPETPPDLAAICQKAMCKETSGRYASTSALADDLRRWLSDSPIEARPAGYVERLRRWSRREPKVALLTGVVALLLLVGTGLASTMAVMASVNARQVTAALGQAQDEKQRANTEAGHALQAEQEAKNALAVAEQSEQDAIKHKNRAEVALKDLKTAYADLEVKKREVEDKEQTALAAVESLKKEIALRKQAEYEKFLSAGKQAILNGKFDTALEFLNQCEPELRTKAWQQAFAQANHRNHTQVYAGAVIEPDQGAEGVRFFEKTIVAGGRSGPVAAFSLINGKKAICQWPFERPAFNRHSIAFIPSGWEFWDLYSNSQRTLLKYELAVKKAPRHLVQVDGALFLGQITPAKPEESDAPATYAYYLGKPDRQTIIEYPVGAKLAKVYADGGQLVMADGHGRGLYRQSGKTFQVTFDLEGGEKVQEFQDLELPVSNDANQPADVSRLAFAGQRVALRLTDAVEVWESRGKVVTIVPLESPLTSLALSPDGELVCACAGQAAFVWESDSGKLVQHWVQERFSEPLFTSETQLAWFSAEGLHVWTRPKSQPATP